MASLRHAAYRASLLAPSALRLSRVALRPFRYVNPVRQSVALFSIRNRLMIDELAHNPGDIAPRGDIGQPSKNLYVGNLFFDVTQNQLKAHFDRYGDIVSVKVVTSAEGHSKGYGFIEFADQEAAQNAQIGSNLSVFAGRRIIVHYAAPSRQSEVRASRSSPGEPTSTLFVGNLNFDMSDKELNELFRPLKGIKDVRISVDRKTGRPRGFAHADFVDVESAVAAKAELDGKISRDRQLRVDFSAGAAFNRDQRNTAGGLHAARRSPRDYQSRDGGYGFQRRDGGSGFQRRDGGGFQRRDEGSGFQRRDGRSDNEPRNTYNFQAHQDQSTSNVDNLEARDEGSHEPPQNLENQPESNQEQDFEKPEEHATQKLEKEIDEVPENQAEKKD